MSKNRAANTPDRATPEMEATPYDEERPRSLLMRLRLVTELLNN